jgi:MFS family permease
MVNIFQFIGSVPIILYMDKFGRRRLAIFGGVAMGIPHIIMAGIVGRFSSNWPAHKGVGWFGVALICKSFYFSFVSCFASTLTSTDIYILAYAMSYGPLGWVLPAEIFPSSRRAKGVGLATAVNWLANFIIGTIVPQMLVSIGWGTFLFFGVFCALAALFSFFFVPETSNRSLEQVASVFGDNLAADEEELRSQIDREIWAETSARAQAHV